MQDFAARQAFYVGNTVVIPKGGISPVWLYAAIGAIFLVWFFVHLKKPRAGRAGTAALHPHVPESHRQSGSGTQLAQWLTMQGTSSSSPCTCKPSIISAPIQTGVALIPATIGILLTSALAGPLPPRRSQKVLIVAGFIITIAGMLLLLLLSRNTDSFLAFLPGLFFIGAGVGIMLTMSVNVVQSAFPEQDQGEISGLPGASPTWALRWAPPL